MNEIKEINNTLRFIFQYSNCNERNFIAKRNLISNPTIYPHQKYEYIFAHELDCSKTFGKRGIVFTNSTQTKFLVVAIKYQKECCLSQDDKNRIHHLIECYLAPRDIIPEIVDIGFYFPKENKYEQQGHYFIASEHQFYCTFYCPFPSL